MPGSMIMMMTRIRRTVFAFIVLLLIPVFLDAQQRDFGTWWELELDREVRGMDLALELEQRFRENSTRYDRSLVTLAASAPLNSFLEVGGGFRFLTVMDAERGLQPRYRLHVDGSGSYDLSRLELSLRARLQYGFEEFIDFGDLNSNILVNRMRIRTAYDFFGTRFSVFGAAETWGVFGNEDGRFLKRMRYTAGMGYRIDMGSSLGFSLMVEDEFHQVRPDDTLVLVLGYSRTL